MREKQVRGRERCFSVMKLSFLLHERKRNAHFTLIFAKVTHKEKFTILYFLFILNALSRARSHILRFGAKYIFKEARFLFLLYVYTNKFGESQKMGRHCPRMPRVSTSLLSTCHDCYMKVFDLKREMSRVCKTT